MPKAELINNVSEDENNRTEESKTSNDEYLSDFTKLQPRMNKPCVSKESVKENCPRKYLSDLLAGLEILSGVLGKYKSMTTNAESICYLDKYEIRESCVK